MDTGTNTEIDVGDAIINSCLFQPVKGGYIYMNAVDALEPASILVYNVTTNSVNMFHKSAESVVDPGYLSKPESIQFDVKSVDDADAYAYGLLYEPKVFLTSSLVSIVASFLFFLKRVLHLWTVFLKCSYEGSGPEISDFEKSNAIVELLECGYYCSLLLIVEIFSAGLEDCFCSPEIFEVSYWKLSIITITSLHLSFHCDLSFNYA